MHPPKKQRLEAAQKDGKGVAKVAEAGAGARVGAKVKRKDAIEKTSAGQAGAGEGLIPTAPVGGSTETAPVAAWTQQTKGAAAVDAATAGKQATTTPVSEQRKTNPTKSDPKPTTAPSKPQAAKKPTKNPTKPTAGSASSGVGGKQLHTARRMQPMKPLTSDGQNVLGRPKDTSGSNPTRGIEGRDVVFVTRKTGLGSYMRRCKALLVDDGYVFPLCVRIRVLIVRRLNQITLHALCVAIPHAVMLLYALIDILPFPRQFIHHEIQTSSVECHDEMSFVAGLAADGAGKGKGKALAIFEEDEAGMRSRTKVSRGEPAPR
jgi:hypothetical protein